MADNTPRRRIVSPETRSRVELKMSIDDISPETVINDALQAMAIEVTRYRSKVARGSALELSEARVLQGYIKAMCELQKERREMARAEKLDNLSNEELIALAKKVLADGSTIMDATPIQDEPQDDQ